MHHTLLSQLDNKAEQLKQLQQQLQAAEATLPAETSKHQATCALLEQLQARLAATAAELNSSQSECSHLKSALAAKDVDVERLCSKLQEMEKEVAVLNHELDSKLDDLRDMKYRGKELLTYQGVCLLQQPSWLLANTLAAELLRQQLAAACSHCRP
jgi:chromosome segregation ATPase